MTLEKILKKLVTERDELDIVITYIERFNKHESSGKKRKNILKSVKKKGGIYSWPKAKMLKHMAKMRRAAAKKRKAAQK